MAQQYLGRIVAIGRNRQGACAAMYRVSSRSFPNRMAVLKPEAASIVPKPGYEGDVFKNHRVLIDLDTTRMGPVLGDMRFTNTRLDIQLGGSGDEATACLQSSIGELHTALIEAGYTPQITCAPIGIAPKLPHPPEAERPRPTGAFPADGHVNVTA